jgi:hypothetical protein
MIALDLAGEAYASQPFLGQFVFLGFGHLAGFTGNKFHATSGAFRIAATGVQLINAGLIGQRQYQPFALGNFYCSNTVHG